MQNCLNSPGNLNMDKEDLLLIINTLLGVVAFFGAIVGKNLTDAIKELKKTDQQLMEKFDKYVRRDDLDDIKRQLAGIFARLDDIRESLGNKVSREECSTYRRDGNGK